MRNKPAKLGGNEMGLSFEDYAAWCKSRVPAFDPGQGPSSAGRTLLPADDDDCPVTVRSRGQVMVVPKSKRSV